MTLETFCTATKRSLCAALVFNADEPNIFAWIESLRESIDALLCNENATPTDERESQSALFWCDDDSPTQAVEATPPNATSSANEQSPASATTSATVVERSKKKAPLARFAFSSGAAFTGPIRHARAPVLHDLLCVTLSQIASPSLWRTWRATFRAKTTLERFGAN